MSNDNKNNKNEEFSCVTAMNVFSEKELWEMEIAADLAIAELKAKENGQSTDLVDEEFENIKNQANESIARIKADSKMLYYYHKKRE